MRKMMKTTVRYARYALTSLSTVAFLGVCLGRDLN